MDLRDEYEVNPFLHIDEQQVYNPLTDRTVVAGEDAYALFRAFERDGVSDETLERDGWIVRRGTDLSRQYRLKIVSLETASACNQKCYFCPVSVAPREDEEMPLELFESIVAQLAPFRSTIDAIFLQNYNEPTIDRRFTDLVARLFEAQFPVSVLSNGTGLTPGKVDALMKAGTLRYLCINLSTLDSDRYVEDRGANHLKPVLRNLEYMRDKRVAEEMRIVVLGKGDAVHEQDFQEIRARFDGSRFQVQSYVTNDRAGWLPPVGLHVPAKRGRLAGCDLVGSRPLQHLHITAAGRCVLCCQDYDENYVVGDLKTQSLQEVLQGDELARMRRWAYGVDDAPEDFICRTCVWARTKE